MKHNDLGGIEKPTTNNGKQKENLTSDNKIFIYGSFDESLVENVIQHLPKMIDDQAKKKKGEILVYVDSNGGYTRYLWNLVAFLEMAKNRGIEVKTYALGYVYSCGSLLAITGDKRYISHNSEHLLHLGSSGMEVRTPLQLEREKRAVKKHFDRVVRHYNKYANVPDLEEKLKDDYYSVFDKTLITYGLADKFIEDQDN